MKTLPLIQFFSISDKLNFWTYSLLKPDDSISVLKTDTENTVDNIKCTNASKNLDIFSLSQKNIKLKHASGNYVLNLKQRETESDTSYHYTELARTSADIIMFDVYEKHFLNFFGIFV
jgi:hypothetical protein